MPHRHDEQGQSQKFYVQEATASCCAVDLQRRVSGRSVSAAEGEATRCMSPLSSRINPKSGSCRSMRRAKRSQFTTCLPRCLQRLAEFPSPRSNGEESMRRGCISLAVLVAPYAAIVQTMSTGGQSSTVRGCGGVMAGGLSSQVERATG